MISEISAGWIGFLQTYAVTLQVMAVVTVVLISISSLDDLFVDACFWTRALYRRLVIRPRHDRLTPAELAARPEQRLALMVPAWREFDVIEVMVENAVRSFDYENYVIFIGTYANDPETRSIVRRLSKRHERVVAVDLAQNGPTSKADCLNGIVRAIFQAEKTTGETFAGMILHDCEDVVHPLELRFFNYLLPRKDLIQIPVVSLERGYAELVAGTYMDEFAEWHGKDLVVREAVARAVPSAGVGTCLSHRAMVALTGDHMEPFNVRSLTEDYDIAARLAKEGLTSIIATYPVNYRVNRRSRFGFGPSRATSLRMPLCVREYFPNTFRAAYRQKARWTLGISIQGWAQLGWSKSPKANYFLFRDRKALITPSLALAGYFIVINYFLLQFLGLVQAGELPPIFPDNRWVSLLLAFNLIALILRVGQRAWFVGRIYGGVHAALSFPRMAVGSVINFAASVRAVRLYASHLIFRTPITWDKTAHEFPTDAALAQDRRQLGAILLSWRAITEGELQDALAEQARRPRKLGRILLSKGVLDDETLADAISVQTSLPRAEITPAGVEAHSDVMPKSLCVALRAIPVGQQPNGAPVLAVSGPLTADEEAAASASFGAPVSLVVARESEIVAGLRRLSGDSDAFLDGPIVPLLGDLLIDGGHIDAADLQTALHDYQPDADGKLGEYLVRKRFVAPEAMASTLHAQSAAIAAARSPI